MCEKEMVESLGSTGAAVDIEVTPAMIEAGASALAAYSKFDREEDAVKRIFVAMVRVAHLEGWARS
jgi:hypothetical protein